MKFTTTLLYLSPIVLASLILNEPVLGDTTTPENRCTRVESAVGFSADPGYRVHEILVSGIRTCLTHDRATPDTLVDLVDLSDLKPGRVPRLISSGLSVLSYRRTDLKKYRLQLCISEAQYIRLSKISRSPDELAIAFPGWQERCDHGK